MIVIDEFQQLNQFSKKKKKLNLFVFELLFYVIGNIPIKYIVKFVIPLAFFLEKKYQLFKKCYIF